MDGPELPEVRSATPLDYGDAVCTSFNKYGTLLAVGCHDGRVVVWDFGMFKNVYRVLTGHVHPISSLSWSSDGRMLLTASSDWNVFIWDVLDGSILHRFSYGASVLHAEFHPQDSDLFLACPLQRQTVLQRLSSKEQTYVPVPEHLVPKAKAPSDAADKTANGKAAKGRGRGKAAAKPAAAATGRRGRAAGRSSGPAHASPHYAIFDRSGRFIFYGDHKGRVSIIRYPNLEFLKVLSDKASGSIKHLAFSPNGRLLLCNSSDKTLRVMNACYSVDEDVAPDEMAWLLIGEFLDPINRLQWKAACFSNNSSFLIGGSAERAEHKIFIWNCQYSQALAKTLEGPKQGIVFLEWHPKEPVIVSCSSSGLVYVWNATTAEPWSAYAPDFKELEENVEYEEREDEFDIMDDDVMSEDSDEEQEFIDICAISDEEDAGDYLRFLPCVPDSDTPALPEHMRLVTQ